MGEAKRKDGLGGWIRRNLPSKGSAIERVLREGAFSIAFQPLVNLIHGEVFAYEALLRSKSPQFTGPQQMLDAAVAARCICELGRAARKMAVETCENWPLFLNIHPNEFDRGLLVQPDDPIFFHSHPVHVEITESVPLSHFEMCHSVLAEIRSKGVKLAIDDLGAGYSNLKYIADLSPEIVKIDRGLVMELGSGPRYRQLVRHIVDMCEGMGAQVVAEGIETIDELRAVQEAGADYGQGYLLARPAFPPPTVYWPDRTSSQSELSPPRSTGEGP